MFLVVYHRIWTYIQLTAKLNSVNVLFQSRIEVCEYVHHDMSLATVESCLGNKTSQLRLNQRTVLPSIKSEVDALQTNLFENLHVSVVDKPNV